MAGTRVIKGLAVCAAAFCGMTVESVLAQSFNGAWTGEINCAKLSFTKGPLKVPMDLIVSSEKATYSRDVLNANGSRIVGTEEGTGTVVADGGITLTAIWKSADDKPRYAYTASYSGKLSGGRGTLRGTQIWSFDRNTENRSCTITLTLKR